MLLSPPYRIWATTMVLLFAMYFATSCGNKERYYPQGENVGPGSYVPPTENPNFPDREWRR